MYDAASKLVVVIESDKSGSDIATSSARSYVVAALLVAVNLNTLPDNPFANDVPSICVNVAVAFVPEPAVSTRVAAVPAV